MKTTCRANKLNLTPFSFQKGQIQALIFQDALKVRGCGCSVPKREPRQSPRHFGNSGTWPGSKTESFLLNAYSRTIVSQWLSKVGLFFVKSDKSTGGCWEKRQGANMAKNMKPWMLARCFLSIWFHLPPTSGWMTKERKQPHSKGNRERTGILKKKKTHRKLKPEDTGSDLGKTYVRRSS